MDLKRVAQDCGRIVPPPAFVPKSEHRQYVAIGDDVAFPIERNPLGFLVIPTCITRDSAGEDVREFRRSRKRSVRNSRRAARRSKLRTDRQARKVMLAAAARRKVDPDAGWR